MSIEEVIDSTKIDPVQAICDSGIQMYITSGITEFLLNEERNIFASSKGLFKGFKKSRLNRFLDNYMHTSLKDSDLDRKEKREATKLARSVWNNYIAPMDIEQAIELLSKDKDVIVQDVNSTVSRFFNVPANHARFAGLVKALDDNNYTRPGPVRKLAYGTMAGLMALTAVAATNLTCSTQDMIYTPAGVGAVSDGGPRDADVDTSPGTAVYAPRDADVDTSPDAVVYAPRDAGVGASPDAAVNAPRGADVDTSPDASVDAPEDASQDTFVDSGTTYDEPKKQQVTQDRMCPELRANMKFDSTQLVDPTDNTDITDFVVDAAKAGFKTVYVTGFASKENKGDNLNNDHPYNTNLAENRANSAANQVQKIIDDNKLETRVIWKAYSETEAFGAHNEDLPPNRNVVFSVTPLEDPDENPDLAEELRKHTAGDVYSRACVLPQDTEAKTGPEGTVDIDPSQVKVTYPASDGVDKQTPTYTAPVDVKAPEQPKAVKPRVNKAQPKDVQPSKDVAPEGDIITPEGKRIKWHGAVVYNFDSGYDNDSYAEIYDHADVVSSNYDATIRDELEAKVRPIVFPRNQDIDPVVVYDITDKVDVPEAVLQDDAVASDHDNAVLYSENSVEDMIDELYDTPRRREMEKNLRPIVFPREPDLEYRMNA
ncbi:hypothetical protein ACFL3V_05845 [Nanoarchaeota archaeon]